MPSVASTRLTIRGAPALPPQHRQLLADKPSLAQFVILSMLVHLLAIALFGAPSGGTQGGRAMWGTLNVILEKPREEGPPLKLDRGALPNPQLRAPAQQRAPEVSKVTPPSPPADLGISKQMATPPRFEPTPLPEVPVEPPAKPIEEPFTIPPLLDRIVVPDKMEMPPPLKLPAPTETPPAPPPKREPAPIPRAPPPVERAPVETPPPAVAPPPVERAPVETQVIPIPPVTPLVAPPPVEVPALPTPPVIPPVARPPIEVPAVPVPPVTPPVTRPPIEVPAVPIPPVTPLVAPPPVELRPLPVPPVTPPVARPPVEVPAIPVPTVPSVAPSEPMQRAPERATPAEVPAAPRAPPTIERTAPSAPDREIAPRIEREPPVRTEPTPSPAPSPFRQRREPSNDPFPQGSGDPNYDPTKGGLDLDAARRRAAQITREGAGNRAALPFPMPPMPERKTKEQIAIEKARKPDCKTEYQSLGLLAVVPLIANEFGEGNCRW